MKTIHQLHLEWNRIECACIVIVYCRSKKHNQTLKFQFEETCTCSLPPSAWLKHRSLCKMWNIWRPLERCLDRLGVEAVVRHMSDPDTFSHNQSNTHTELKIALHQLSIYILVKNEIPAYATRWIPSGLSLLSKHPQINRAHMATGCHIQFIDTQAEKLNQVWGSGFETEPPQMRKTGLAAVTALHLQLGRVMTDRTFSHSCCTTNALFTTLYLCVFFHTRSHERTLERPLTFDTLGFSVPGDGGGASAVCLHSHKTETSLTLTLTLTPSFDQEFPNMKENAVLFRDCARYRVSAAPAAHWLYGWLSKSTVPGGSEATSRSILRPLQWRCERFKAHSPTVLLPPTNRPVALGSPKLFRRKWANQSGRNRSRSCKRLVWSANISLTAEQQSACVLLLHATLN